MRDDADQFSRRVARQPGVGVECDAVADAWQHVEIADVHGKARIGRSAQQPIELLDFPAFAFPSHPQPFALVPLTSSMEQKKSAARLARVSTIECLDRLTRSVENLRVARLCFGRCIAKVAEDGKVDVRIEIADGLNFEMLSQ